MPGRLDQEDSRVPSAPSAPTVMLPLSREAETEDDRARLAVDRWGNLYYSAPDRYYSCLPIGAGNDPGVGWAAKLEGLEGVRLYRVAGRPKTVGGQVAVATYAGSSAMEALSEFLDSSPLRIIPGNADSLPPKHLVFGRTPGGMWWYRVFSGNGTDVYLADQGSVLKLDDLSDITTTSRWNALPAGLRRLAAQKGWGSETTGAGALWVSPPEYGGGTGGYAPPDWLADPAISAFRVFALVAYGAGAVIAAFIALKLLRAASPQNTHGRAAA